MLAPLLLVCIRYPYKGYSHFMGDMSDFAARIGIYYGNIIMPSRIRLNKILIYSCTSNYYEISF